jgi:uncharacterized protein (DUF2267 family)
VQVGLAGIRPVDAKDAVHAVFRVLSAHVTPEQIRKVQDALPEGVRSVWQGLAAR